MTVYNDIDCYNRVSERTGPAPKTIYQKRVLRFVLQIVCHILINQI